MAFKEYTEKTYKLRDMKAHAQAIRLARGFVAGRFQRF